MKNIQTERNLVKLKQDAFYNASLTKDASFMTTNLHEDFVFTSPRAVVLNKQSYTNDLVLNPAVKLDVFESIEEKIVIAETVAISSGITHAKFKDKDLFAVRVTMTFVYSNQDWQLIAFQETFIP